MYNELSLHPDSTQHGNFGLRQDFAGIAKLIITGDAVTYNSHKAIHFMLR